MNFIEGTCYPGTLVEAVAVMGRLPSWIKSTGGTVRLLTILLLQAWAAADGNICATRQGADARGFAAVIKALNAYVTGEQFSYPNAASRVEAHRLTGEVREYVLPVSFVSVVSVVRSSPWRGVAFCVDTNTNVEEFRRAALNVHVALRSFGNGAGLLEDTVAGTIY